MAKGLDDLIQYLLEEIALSGNEGQFSTHFACSRNGVQSGFEPGGAVAIHRSSSCVFVFSGASLSPAIIHSLCLLPCRSQSVFRPMSTFSSLVPHLEIWLLYRRSIPLSRHPLYQALLLTAVLTCRCNHQRCCGIHECLLSRTRQQSCCRSGGPELVFISKCRCR